MSQRRLIVSLALISSCLALVIALASLTFPLKATPLSPQSVSRDASSQPQMSSTAPVPEFQRVLINYYDFDPALNHADVNAVQVKLSQLLGHPDDGSVYDQSKVEAMKKVLEDFWSERGITAEVRTSITPSQRSTRYAILKFDVYKQTVLTGKLEGGVAGGISNGIAGGVSGGVSGGISTRASAEEPSVDISTIWTDAVKRGTMPLQVRGMGTLVRGEGSKNFVARVTVPASMSADLKPGQYATVRSKNGPVGEGHITSIGPQSNDTRTVDIFMDTLYRRSSAGLEVMAYINIGQLDNVLFIGRPVNSEPNGSINLFKISNDGAEAFRTQVKLGRASADTIEVLHGLKEGDKVIISDMSSVANADRIRLTDEKHVTSH